MTTPTTTSQRIPRLLCFRAAVNFILIPVLLVISADGLAGDNHSIRTHVVPMTQHEHDKVPTLSYTPPQRRSFLLLPFAAVTMAQRSCTAIEETPPVPTNKLTFRTFDDSGVRVADILQGAKDGTVLPTSKVNVHIKGRLLGKQGWIFEDSQGAGEDPFRLDLGTGTVISGLEEGLQGMQVGGRRRIVIPSAAGYTSRSLEPIPRDFGNRQRLYTTVMNSVRIDRERQALGADLAGVVVLDVELLRIRN